MENCIIIDDEEHAIAGLTSYITKIPQLNLKASYTDPFDALLALQFEDPIDILFIDIDLPGISGIDLAKSIRLKVKYLIFTTAHAKYGYDAFEVDADAYLLKPYDFTKFAGTIAKVLTGSTSHMPRRDLERFFFVKRSVDLKIFKVSLDELVAVESKGNYVLIYTARIQILTYMSLNFLVQTLSNDARFVQFQRSFVINIDFIDYIDGNTIYMTNGVFMTVGDYYRKSFSVFLDEKLLRSKKVDVRHSGS